MVNLWQIRWLICWPSNPFKAPETTVNAGVPWDRDMVYRFTGNRPTKRDIFLHNVFTVKRIFITIFRWTMNRTRPSLKQWLNVKTQSWIMSENITCTIWIPSYVGFGFVQSLNCTQNGIFMLEILRLPSSLHNHLYDPIHVIAYRNSIMINVVTKHGKKGDI